VKKDMAKVWRQGDVVIREVSEEEYNELKRWRLSQQSELKDVVIKSETGNPHILHTSVAQELLTTGEENTPVFATASQQPILVEHPQHGSFTLPEGKYLIYTVREARRGLFGDVRRVLD
jgi:hypothetical protein